MSLRGSYSARIDDRNRLKIPAEFRRFIESNWGNELFITSLDGTEARIYPLPVWQDFEERLRSLSPFDRATCAESLCRTGRGIVVHEASEIGGVGDALIANLLSEVFGYLHAPIQKVCGRQVPVPSSPQLEDAMMPSAAEIVRCALPLITDY